MTTEEALSSFLIVSRLLFVTWIDDAVGSLWEAAVGEQGWGAGLGTRRRTCGCDAMRCDAMHPQHPLAGCMDLLVLFLLTAMDWLHSPETLFAPLQFAHSSSPCTAGAEESIKAYLTHW